MAGGTAIEFRDNCQAINWRTYTVYSNQKGSIWTASDGGLRPSVYNHVMRPNGFGCLAGGVSGDDRAGLAASSNHPTGVNVAFLDDSVRFISETIDWAVWLGMGSIKGGELAAP